MPQAAEQLITQDVPGLAGEALRAALGDPSSAWPSVVLRPHQIEALDELASRLSAGSRRTWVDSPTGSGKTIMFSALAAALGGSTLVLVPRRNLAGQTAEGLAKHFPSVPVTVDGAQAAGREGVVIATYQAALRRAHEMRWEDVTLLICDEAHTTLGQQTRRLLDRAQNAVIVGFTATGSTTTGHVEQIFGPVATTLDRQSAIERGILAPLRSLRVERAVDLSDVAHVRGDFDQASLGRALDRALWHKACAEVWAAHFQELGLAGVAYTATVAQAESLAEELRARGAVAVAVSGQTPKRELQRILFDFGAKRIDVLCNADLLTEGWDETRAAVVLHLAPTTSERVFVQRLGRVMRPSAGKEAVSVEFLPAGEKMGVQTSHDVFGRGWYKPLGRVAGPPEGGERGKLAKAAELLAAQGTGTAALVNPGAAPAEIAAGLADGGWRDADPGDLPPTLMETWVEAAALETDVTEVAAIVDLGVSPGGAAAWLALSGLLAREARDGSDQPLWRSWATALLVQLDLRDALPDDVPRRVLDRLRMTSRERLRALWWHADASDKWDRLATLEQLGRSGDRRRRWSALDETASWAPAWSWDVSRGLADSNRPGRNQELARIAAWEANHLIQNGGELSLIGIWMRAAGQPPPQPIPPEDPSVLRLGQAARLAVMLGPGDVPTRSEYLRLAARAAATVGGWAELRGYLDAVDFTGSDARRALRAAIGSMHPKALVSRRAWNSLRARFPRLPEAESVGVGDGKKRGAGRRRRRRRRLSSDKAALATSGVAEGGDGTSADGDSAEVRKSASTAGGADENGASPSGTPGSGRRRRRRRRRRRGSGAAASDENATGSTTSPSASGNGSGASDGVRATPAPAPLERA